MKQEKRAGNRRKGGKAESQGMKSLVRQGKGKRGLPRPAGEKGSTESLDEKLLSKENQQIHPKVYLWAPSTTWKLVVPLKETPTIASYLIVIRGFLWLVGKTKLTKGRGFKRTPL